MSKCAECGGPSSAYCVEQNKVFCKKCVGRLFIPGLKAIDQTLEELDTRHGTVVYLTQMVMYFSVVVVMLSALWNSGIGDDYFKGGGNTCPALSVVRKALAKFDANVFYYHKANLSAYCDIEDSFWRLLMDGWLRGVVSGSDSVLLLFSTLPKAWMFKTAISTFLRPIYAFFYAVLGLLLSFVIIQIEDTGLWILNHLPSFCRKRKADEPAVAGSAAGCASGAAGAPQDPAAAGGAKASWMKAKGKVLKVNAFKRIKSAPNDVLRLPKTLYTKLTTKTTFFDSARLIFIAIGCSGLLRLAVHHVGFDDLAALGKPEAVNMWQLLFEPGVFFYLSHLCTSVNTKLGKSVWKKAAASASAPLTLRRQKPSKDVLDWFDYEKSRIMRTYVHYRQQAQDVLHFLVDEIFNAVIVLRLVGITFGLAPYARQVFRSIGFGDVIDKHREWFMDATGFTDTDSGASYFTDYLMRFGFARVLVGVSAATHAVEREAEVLIPHSFSEQIEFAKQVAWRFVVPLIFWYIETKGRGFLDKQRKAFKKEWEGNDWKDGKYAEMMDKYGSYWNVVAKDEWQPPVSPTKK
mmetsp:Transcript_73163/g.210085  ORF Transcript_73163/g.210085 Transcript_73163/m.210085 type:complete len:575 (-) Transcript_73163:263-1987(-)